MVWIAFGIFAGGMAFRLFRMARLARRKDAVVFDYMSARYALRSIPHWVIPFSGVNMRKHPAMTSVAFVFHALLLATPVFLCAHVLLGNDSWNISWWPYLLFQVSGPITGNAPEAMPAGKPGPSCAANVISMPGPMAYFEQML